jgi:dehydrogenase/reductase SDR family member 7B
MSSIDLTTQCKSSTKDGLKGKIVFLTGATGGLGRALAWQLADSNVSRIYLSGRSESALQEVIQECKTINNSVECEIVICDLMDADQVAKCVQKIKDDKIHVDILINNGGVSSRSTFLSTEPEIDRQIMQINFFSGAAFAKALLPGMIPPQGHGGRLIWISSVQGLMGIPERTSYGASKFAVQGYTESLRPEVQALGISVHTVSPGYIRTNLSKNAVKGDGSAYGQVDKTTAQGADPVEVAAQLLDRCVTSGELDFTIALNFSATVALWMKALCPGLLRVQLVKRFEKSQKEKKED